MSTPLKPMSQNWSVGLNPDHELFFASRPADPEMRESTSIWLYEDNGTFGFPRVGIEGEAHSWDNRLYHSNFAFADGRVLQGTGRGAVPSPFGADGRPTLFGAGPERFRLVEPFRKWVATYDGMVIDTHVDNQIHETVDTSRLVPLKYEVELTMITPCWTQEYTPDVLAKMTEDERTEVAAMGIGWRLEQQFRAEGTFTIDGVTRDFKARGNRIKRQSVRPMGAFRGHTWQAAVFPDGRAFGYIAYPTAEPGKEPYNEGYIYQNGKMYAARATKVPWLRRLVGKGDDVSFELETEIGPVRIGGSTALVSFRVNNKEMGRGFDLQQGGARYTWDDQTTYGMIERSAFGSETSIG